MKIALNRNTLNRLNELKEHHNEIDGLLIVDDRKSEIMTRTYIQLDLDDEVETIKFNGETRQRYKRTGNAVVVDIEHNDKFGLDRVHRMTEKSFNNSEEAWNYFYSKVSERQQKLLNK